MKSLAEEKIGLVSVKKTFSLDQDVIENLKCFYYVVAIYVLFDPC